MTENAQAVATYTPDQLRPFMSETFLAVLAEAARVYTAAEADPSLSLPADLAHFVDWCRALGEPLPAQTV